MLLVVTSEGLNYLGCIPAAEQACKEFLLQFYWCKEQLLSLMSCLLCVKTYSDSQMRAAPSSWGNVWGICGCYDD